MKPINNWIICEPLRDNTELKTKSGLYINTYVYKGQEGKHVNRVFKVLQTPDKFTFFKNKPRKETLNEGRVLKIPEWETNIECKPGDIILTSKTGSMNAIINDELHFIDYTQIYIILRPGTEKEIDGNFYDVIMANGYILCEDVKELEWTSKFIINPDAEKAKNTIEWGKIARLATPNKQYWDGKQDYVGVELNVGDIVKKRNKDIHQDLESSMYSFFDKDKTYFVIQQKDIIAIKYETTTN